MKRPIALFCCLLAFWYSGLAQNKSGQLPQDLNSYSYENLIFENFTQADGLPDQTVHCVLKDRQGFLWFGTNNGLVRFDGLNFKIYQNDPADSTSLAQNSIHKLIEDHEGILWIATHGGSLNRFDPLMETFSVFPLESKLNSDPGAMVVFSVMEDRQEQIWVGTRYDGLFIIGPERDTNSVRQYLHDPSRPESLAGNTVFMTFEDRHGRIWVSSSGLNLFNPETDQAIRFQREKGNPNSLVSNLVFKIEEDSDDRLWIATIGGISVLDMRDTSFTNYYHRAGDPGSLSDYRVWDLTVDMDDKVWISTRGGGLNLLQPGSGKFEYFQYNPLNPYSMVHNGNHAVLKDRDGIIWSATSHGISKLSPPNFGYIPLVTTLDEKRSSNFDSGIHDILVDSLGEVWIGTHSNGLYRYDPIRGAYRHFGQEGEGNIVFTYTDKIEEDRNGRILIKVRDTLRYYDPGIGDFQPLLGRNSDLSERIGPVAIYTVDRQKHFWIINREEHIFKVDAAGREILESFDMKIIRQDHENFSPRDMEADLHGNLWLGGEGGGLQFFSPREKKMYRYRLSVDIPVNLAPVGHEKYLVDSRGAVWISTPNRLIRFQPDQDGQVTQLSTWETKGGFIREDQKGQFWLIRSTSITAVDPLTGPQETYSLRVLEGTLDGSMGVAPSGKLYLGGFEGLYTFDPDKAALNTNRPPIVFTDLKLFNQSVPIRGSYGDTLPWPSPLRYSVRFTKAIKLPYYHNSFTIEFAALDFFQPENNQYKYLLEGYDNDTLWTNAERPFATYNPTPGNYTFRVWGTNSDGKWNPEEAVLYIKISPPWYWSGWSKTIYTILFLGLLYLFYRFQLNRQLAIAENRRLQELDAFKTRLYTNLTHEFRTPLTVISGMADQVLDNPKQWFREGLTMIKRNSRQLLGLVNQLLDISKLESGTLPVKLIQDDIVQYLKYLTESFHSYAESKDIRLHLLPQQDELYMDFDPEKIRSIFSNLVGNAIKFTPAGGDVYITVDACLPARRPSRQGLQRTAHGGSLELKVKDNGMGIPAAQLPHIFDRFYQVTSPGPSSGGEKNRSPHVRDQGGTGIGLSLTKELVKLLDGSISVSSKEEKGTEFTVMLPIRQEAELGVAAEVAGANIVPAGNAEPATVALAQTLSSEGELPLALLIEDHQDVLQYLASCLQGQYRLEMATDGRQGIEKAVDLVPDVIISDVMMPGKDGFEVVDALKHDERTSHIPIILLTAKADLDSRLEGLERGADAYLAKPFEKKELEVRLRKLIELRRQLSARYGMLAPVGAPANKAEEKEDAFLQKVRQIVEARMEEENFGIPQLCRELGISRTQLHRKLKALTDKSTSQVIRTIRMQQAKALLQNSALNVSEVGYAVGYGNPSHFTQEFTKEFGEAPTNFRG